MRLNRGAVVQFSLVIGLLSTIVGGCGGGTPIVGREPTEPHAARSTASQPNRGDAATDVPGLIVLRRACLPIEEVQPFRILLSERRDTTGEGVGSEHAELDLDLTGTLALASSRGARLEAIVRFTRIVMTCMSPGDPSSALRYDSEKDRPGKGNPLADVLSVIAKAELRLTFLPTGRFVELNGLDPLWRKADKIMVEPGFQHVQWLFRDIGMGELLAEALFPPMPADSVRPGESWEATLPANLILTAPLQARCQAVLVGVDHPSGGSAVARVRMNGTLSPQTEIHGASQPGLVPEVLSGRQDVELSIQPDLHSLAQVSRRDLNLKLTLRPPQGEARREMRIRQIRVLESRRGKSLAAAG